MGGQSAFSGLTTPIKPVTPTKKKDKPDLSVDDGDGDGDGKATAPKDNFGLSALGDSTSPTNEGITTTTGSSPARKKKPTIVLLGEKP